MRPVGIGLELFGAVLGAGVWLATRTATKMAEALVPGIEAYSTRR